MLSNMEKKITFMFIFIFSIGFFCQSSLFSQEIKNPPPDIERIVKSGVLRVAMVEIDQPPFFFTNHKGELAGLDVDLANTLAEGLGVRAVFNRTATSFNQLIPKVANNEVDIVISKLSRTSARAKTVAFSTPYVLFRQALMVNRIGLARKAGTTESIPPFIKNFEGRIGIIKNSSYVLYSKQNFPKAEIVELDTWEDVVSAALTGRVLAAYRDEMEIKKVNLLYPDASLKIKTIILSDTQDYISMAINWKSTQFLRWVNIFLENNKIFYTSTQIIDKYGDDLRNLNKK